jgi:hypothetical protein
MPLSPSELRQIFLDDLPEAVIVDTTRIIIKTYAAAYRYCLENYPGPEAHDLYPIVRRSMIERNWRARLARHAGLDVSVQPNACGGCFHTELRVGRVVMTVSAVEKPSDLVREAVFRNVLSGASQLELFKEVEEPPADALLYAVLLHGPLRSGLLAAPSFAQIAFPNGEFSDYVDRFNLMDCYPVLQEEWTKRPSTETMRRKPRLRRRKDEEAG